MTLLFYYFPPFDLYVIKGIVAYTLAAVNIHGYLIWSVDTLTNPVKLHTLLKVIHAFFIFSP